MFLSLKNALNGNRIYQIVRYYLLDEYPAEAAYSLRALSSSFANNAVVRVRRDSDNAELDFTAAEVSDGTLLNWVGTGGTNNGFVETWYDQSGNNNDVEQLTANNQPKIVEFGVLVVGGLDFDGSDDSLQSTIFTLSPQPVTKIVVGQFDAFSFNDYLVDGSSSNRGVLGSVGNTGDWLLFAGALDSTGVAPLAGVKYLGFGVFNGASSVLAVNGKTLGTQSIGTSGLEQVTIGRSASAGGFLNGKIKEVIVYPSDQTANRLAIETNINDAYDIYYNGPLLDEYPAEAAYSFRVLSSSFANAAVVRVRRSSDNAELDFTAEDITTSVLINWVGAGNDGFVETWYDQSGNGNNATQLTASSQPKIVENGALLSDGLNFIAPNNWSLNTDYIPPASLTAFSVSFNDTSDGFTYGARDSANERCYLSEISGNYRIGVAEAQSVATSGSTANALQTFAYNGTRKYLYENNVELINLAQGQSVDNVTQGMAIGAFNNSGTVVSNLRGTIDEIIFYSSDKLSDRLKIESNIYNAYNL